MIVYFKFPHRPRHHKGGTGKCGAFSDCYECPLRACTCYEDGVIRAKASAEQWREFTRRASCGFVEIRAEIPEKELQK